MSIKRLVRQNIWNKATEQWEQGVTPTIAKIVETSDGSNVQAKLDEMPQQIIMAQTQAKDDAIDAIRAGVATTGDTLAKQYALIGALQALVHSDDVDLNTVQEIVAFIRENRENLELMGANKVRIDDIVNDFTTVSTVEGKVLDARLGTILKGLVDTLRGDITALQNQAQTFVTETQHTEDLANIAMSSRPTISETPPLNPVDGQIWHQPVGFIEI